MSEPAAAEALPPLGETLYARRQRRAVLACLQFLRESGYDLAAEALLEESFQGLGCDASLELQLPSLGQDSLLLTALDAWDRRLHSPPGKPSDASPAAAKDPLDDGVVEENPRPPVAREAASFDGLHGKSNIITVRFDPVDESRFVTGAVDRTVRIFDWKTHSLIREVQAAPAPILSMDLHPSTSGLTLVGCMNGEHALLDTSKESRAEQVVQTFQDHKKYVVCAKWSPDGRFFASGSHDNTVCVYGMSASAAADDVDEAKDSSAAQPGTFTKLKTFYFQDRVEALEWIGGGISPLRLVVASRGDNYLRAIDLETLKPAEQWNMNAAGDDHVSFTCLDLRASPGNSDYLLAATDASRAIMFRAGSAVQVRNFYGALNDEYSSPRLAWDRYDSSATPAGGPHVYATSQSKNSVYGWDIGTAKIVATLEGHTQIVRGLDSHPSQQLLASCGYDKSVKLWQPAQL